MTAELTGLCQEHSFESAAELCRRCGLEYCELCVLYPFGAKKPLCKECAMIAGGVRNHGSRAEMPRRDLKRRVKAWEARAASMAGAAAATEADNPVLNDPLAPTEEDLERVPAAVPADNGAQVAAELAQSFDDPPPPPPAPPAPPAEPEQKPADGVAPPIDWSQPFG